MGSLASFWASQTSDRSSVKFGFHINEDSAKEKVSGRR
jgi:hypothetical protein